jgi:hypothetical protein
MQVSGSKYPIMSVIKINVIIIYFTYLISLSIKSNQIKSNQIKSNRIESNQINALLALDIRCVDFGKEFILKWIGKEGRKEKKTSCTKDIQHHILQFTMTITITTGIHLFCFAINFLSPPSPSLTLFVLFLLFFVLFLFVFCFLNR